MKKKKWVEKNVSFSHCKEPLQILSLLELIAVLKVVPGEIFSPLSFVGVRVLPEVPLLGKGEAGAVPSADPGPAASPLNHAICCPNPGVHTPVRSQFSVRAVEPALGKQVPTCWRPGPPGGLRGQLLVLWLQGAFSALGTACACARVWPLPAPLALCSPAPLSGALVTV